MKRPTVLVVVAQLAVPLSAFAHPPPRPIVLSEGALAGRTLSQRLGHATFRAARATAYGVGGRVDRASARLEAKGSRLAESPRPSVARTGRAMQSLGRGLKKAAGTDALLDASLEFTASVGTSTLSWRHWAGLSVNVGLWTGSVRYWEKNGLHPTDVHLNFGGGPSTFLGGVSMDRLSASGSSTLPGKLQTMFSPLFVSAYSNRRAHGVAFLMPSGPAFGAGEVRAVKPGQYARGPYAGASLPVAIVPLAGPAVATLNVGGTLFHPGLHGATDRLRRPAEWVQHKKDALGHAVSGILTRTPPVDASAAPGTLL
jgi:hypothetical protein